MAFPLEFDMVMIESMTLDNGQLEYYMNLRCSEPLSHQRLLLVTSQYLSEILQTKR